MEWTSRTSPAAAVPVSTKTPVPMMAPTPSAVNDHGPSDFRSRCSGPSASLRSFSILFVRRSWLAKGFGKQATGVRQRAKGRQSAVAPSTGFPARYFRAATPGAFFLILGFREPRGAVCLGLGAAFFRASRFSFFQEEEIGRAHV